MMRPLIILLAVATVVAANPKQGFPGETYADDPGFYVASGPAPATDGGAGGLLEWHVSKGLGRRGYDAVRVSVITEQDGADARLRSDAAAAGAWPFEYDEPFEYKWRQFHLSSTLLQAAPGATLELRAANDTLRLRVPKPTDGVRGIIFGDPCTSNMFKFPNIHPHACWPGSKAHGDVQDTFTALLDLAAPDLDFWAMLGPSQFRGTPDCNESAALHSYGLDSHCC